jgi:hypothetical protein
MFIYPDYDEYLFIDTSTTDYPVSEDLFDRYNLALLEWEAVQDELAKIYAQGK